MTPTAKLIPKSCGSSNRYPARSSSCGCSESKASERKGRNPATGETITIAASKSPKFKAGKALKDAVKA